MTDRMTNAEIDALCEVLKNEMCWAESPSTREALQQAHTAIRQLQQPWQGIESAPKDGTRVLLGSWAVEVAGAKPVFRQTVGFWNERFAGTDDWDDDIGDVVYRGAWTDLTVASFSHEEYTELNPTAWMPLPHAPEPGQ